MFYGLTRVLFVLSDFELYKCVWEATTCRPETPLNTIIVGIAYSFAILGTLGAIFSIERYLLRTRYIFTIIALVMLILSIISILAIVPTEMLRTSVAIFGPVLVGIVTLLYLYIAKNSSGEPRKRALGIIAGLLIIMLGIFFGSRLTGNLLDPLGLFEIRIIIEPFIIIIGGSIFTFSQR